MKLKCFVCGKTRQVKECGVCGVRREPHKPGCLHAETPFMELFDVQTIEWTVSGGRLRFLSRLVQS